MMVRWLYCFMVKWFESLVAQPSGCPVTRSLDLDASTFLNALVAVDLKVAKQDRLKPVLPIINYSKLSENHYKRPQNFQIVVSTNRKTHHFEDLNYCVFKIFPLSLTNGILARHSWLSCRFFHHFHFIGNGTGLFFSYLFFVWEKFNLPIFRCFLICSRLNHGGNFSVL